MKTFPFSLIFYVCFSVVYTLIGRRDFLAINPLFSRKVIRDLLIGRLLGAPYFPLFPNCKNAEAT